MLSNKYHRDIESNLRIPIILSLLVHLCLLYFLPMKKSRQIIYVTFPVELITIPPIQAVREKEKAEPQKEAIVAEKIIKKTKKEEPTKKTEEPPQPQRQPVSSLSLEAAKFPYTYYLNQIRKKVSANWFFNRQSGNLRNVVYFRIKPNGEIIALRLSESSGDRIFDQLSSRAVELSAPFPPLPQGFEEEYLGVYFEFAFRE
ncbi:MAG: hypothetical protein AUJ85_10210 [Elusimicrobia bacterium CG1_02_37_114]|nr:MAG: hypothetical protein AUJ85_10210 [Elusimicrobia bacterium CG1_02_37_114]PIV52432.1 MAG: hypothetical protein COS17_09110 [Elusimicrobia bacterium CG02_land_8_20_14_3_00_37_13]PIZ13156.1 MAG: hypothetical protein COY53_06235 [Elusimicrobia bacterium CG_4_10_14_0_8_um_filter_37_32]